MAWLWTDTLALLLVEHDGVPTERLAAWIRHPIAYRIEEGQTPLQLARQLLGEDEAPPAQPMLAAG